MNMKKKTKRKLYTTNTTSDIEYSKIIKITIGVVLVLVLTYLITGLATGEIKWGKKKKMLRRKKLAFNMKKL